MTLSLTINNHISHEVARRNWFFQWSPISVSIMYEECSFMFSSTSTLVSPNEPHKIILWNFIFILTMLKNTSSLSKACFFCNFKINVSGFIIYLRMEMEPSIAKCKLYGNEPSLLIPMWILIGTQSVISLLKPYFMAYGSINVRVPSCKSVFSTRKNASYFICKYLETDILKHMLVKKLATVIIYLTVIVPEEWCRCGGKKHGERKSLRTEAMRRLEPQ